MATIGTRFTYDSLLLVNRNPTSTVRVGTAGAAHLINVKNHSKVDYSVDLVGNIAGTLIRYGNGTRNWPEPGVLVPATDEASPMQPLTIPGPAGQESLRCNQFTYRLAGAPGPGTPVPGTASASVGVIP